MRMQKRTITRFSLQEVYNLTKEEYMYAVELPQYTKIAFTKQWTK